MIVQNIFKRIGKYARTVQQYNEFTNLLNKPKSLKHQFHMGNMCHIYYTIQRDVKELYKPQVTQILQYFDKKYFIEQIGKHVYLKKIVWNVGDKSNKFNKFIAIKINPLTIQINDHPYLRQNFYFHELKEMEKYANVQAQIPKSTPKILRNMKRHAMQEQLLNKNNPYGIPLHSSKMAFQLNYSGLWYKFVQILGQIKLDRFGLTSNSLKIVQFNSPKQYLLGQSLSEQMQSNLMNFFEYNLGLNNNQLLKIKQLAHIYGIVRKTYCLMDLFSFYAQIELQQNQKILP